jgi:hypothetical protein
MFVASAAYLVMLPDGQVVDVDPDWQVTVELAEE